MSDMDRKLEITFEGGHRVTVTCAAGSASFLKLAALNRLPVIAVTDDYYGVDRPEVTQ